MKNIVAIINPRSIYSKFWFIGVRHEILLKFSLLLPILTWSVIFAVAFTTGFANFYKYTSQSDSINKNGSLTNNNRGDKMLNHSKVSVVIQYFQGCPHSPKMLRNVKKAIKGLEKSVHYEEVLIESQEQAEKIGFRGSPTLLINGRDFEDMPVPKAIGLTCRVYPNGIPSSTEIKKKILESLK